MPLRNQTLSLAPRRSRLAVTSFVLGSVPSICIVATFILCAFYESGPIARFLNDKEQIGLLTSLFITVGIAGFIGAGFGVAALVAIIRNRGKLVGIDIAILGICMGLFPVASWVYNTLFAVRSCIK
ncbi:MAG: hypothetical protein NT105_19960 [Verrucomicrobia bacterium]|nr:hypothetical protein [Verrucomicrobiota bacterium]